MGNRFIVFEGIDGSGKTTISKMLLAQYQKHNKAVRWLREPSDSKWGKKIRELARLKDSIPKEQELFYFIEDRKINVRENIIPALKKNQIVILDRYYFSTACYQGARGLDMFEILDKNQEFAPQPDLVFIIDVDVDTALKRIQTGRQSRERLFETKEFLQKVRRNYLKLKAWPHTYIIDGRAKPEEVFQQTITIIAPSW